MLINKKNNKGFSLVEVIVSMLVLSIVISSVLTAFSVSAKANAKTKKVQSAESLMEDLLELAGAVKDSSQYADRVASLFGGTKTVTQALSDAAPVQTVEICTVSGISKGSYAYEVEIVRDTKPSDYSDMNATSMLNFGETGSKSILINASTKGTLFLPGDTENGYDKMALDEFITMRNNKIRTDNESLPEGATPTPEIDPSIMSPAEYETAINEVKSMIDRDVYLETVLKPSGKMELLAYFSYEASADLELADGVNRKLEYQFFPSGEFHKAGDTTEGAEKLDRVYLLYSPAESHWETSLPSADYDIRIYDEQQLLAADVFIVCQENSAQAIDSTLAGKDLATRFNDASQDVKVSFAKRGAAEKAPARVDLYCPAAISCGVVENVTAHNYQMIAEAGEIRVQELTITIRDSDGNEVASDVVACLQ